MRTCLVLPHESADGAWNMAVDEAMLASVVEAPDQAYFRTYEWTEPTLSLGYFQSWKLAEADPRLKDAPLVRRPTGGGAIWHHREITYAIALGASHPSARRGGSLYLDVHAAIARALSEQGVHALRRGLSNAHTAADRPFLCFEDRDAEDLVVGQSKIVGSAQRRRAGAILQHGSILLAHSPAIVDLPGALELAGTAIDAKAWAPQLASVIPAMLGLNTELSTFSMELRERANILKTRVYLANTWNYRR